MRVLKMLYVLIAQAKGRGLITLDTHGGRGRTVKGQMAAPLLHTNTQLYHQTGNLVPKTPRACIQFVSSALRSRVQGKKLQRPQASGQVGVGTRRNVPLAASGATSPHPRPECFHHLLVRALMVQGRQPSERGRRARSSNPTQPKAP